MSKPHAIIETEIYIIEIVIFLLANIFIIFSSLSRKGNDNDLKVFKNIKL